MPVPPLPTVAWFARLRIAAILAFAALGATSLATLHGGPLDIAASLVVLAAALAAIRWPICWLLVGAICMVSGLVPTPTSLTSVILALVGTVDLWQSTARRAAWAMLAMPLVAALWPSHESISAHVSITVLFIVPALVGFTLRGVRRRGDLELELAQLRRTSERASLARDMHDVVASSMSHVVMTADRLRAQPDLAPGTRTGLDLIAAEGRNALAELRGVLTELRTDTPTPSIRCEAIDVEWTRALALLQMRGFTVTAEQRVDGESRDALDPDTIKALCLAIRELAANVVRHVAGTTPDTRVTARLDVPDADAGQPIRLVVANPLPCPSASAVPAVDDDALPPSGFGLVGLRERVEQLGGTVTAGEDAGRWVAVVELPCGPASDARHGEPRAARQPVAAR